MAERYQLPQSCVPSTSKQKDGGYPPSGGLEDEKTRCKREREDTVAFQEGHPPFKGDSPHLRPQPSWAESSPTRSKVLPYGARAGSHTSCKPAQSRRSQTVARGACNRPAVTSDSPLLPRPAGERAGSHAGGMQPRQVGALLRLPTHLAGRPRPMRHATGAPDASCMQLHRHVRHHRASSTAEPIPRLEAKQRTTQRLQPGTTINAAENGPAVMAVAGRQEQRSRRQPSSRPIWGQQENPLSRREDNTPVTHSSNGSRTRNGYPVNHSPRRINSAAGRAAPLAGEASDASPSP
jgi:hypothetical protein